MKGGDIMCCSSPNRRGFQRWGHQSECLCGCDDPAFYRPRFMSKKRRIANLEDLLENLQEETQAVKEEIAKIKKEK